MLDRLYRYFSYADDDYFFYDESDVNDDIEVSYLETLYLTYFKDTDVLALSFIGYNDENSILISNATLGERLPIELGLGGFARFPGAMAAGSNAPLWIDNLIIDQGTIERPPSNVQASDGTFSAYVRVTWGAAAGATGYRVFRQEFGQQEELVAGNLSSTTLAFNDSGASTGTEYTYRVKAIVPTGDGLSASDDGWKGLEAPGDLTASDGTDIDGVNLAWNAVPSATGYRIARSLGTSAAVTFETTDLTYADTTATPGLLFTYKVFALLGNLTSPASTANTGWRGLGVPTGVAATDGSLTTGVLVSWTAVTGATGYKIFRAVGAGAATQVGTTNASTTTYLNTTAVAGTEYTYTVKVVATAGDSPASDADTGWRTVAAPATIAATDGTLTTGVNVTWGSVSGATGYKVFRKVSSSVEDATEVATPTAASYSDTSAVAGTLYTYTVKAKAGTLGDSVSSAPNDGWRTVAVPTGVNATDGTLTDEVTVTWTAVSGATGYKVFRALGSAAAVEIGEAASDATSYSDEPASSGAAPIAGTVYKYTVKAKAGSLGTSAASTANTGWRGLGVPTGVAATDGSLTTGVLVSWTAVTGATGYKIFRAVGAGAATQVGTTNASTTTYLNTTAVAGTEYTYTVKVKATAGDSPASDADTGWRIHTAPTNVQATDGTLTTGVNVTWGAVSGATNYQILRKINDSSDAAVAIATDSASPYLDASAVAGVVYSYSVRVSASAGAGLTSTANTGFRASGFAGGDDDGSSDAPPAFLADGQGDVDPDPPSDDGGAVGDLGPSSPLPFEAQLSGLGDQDRERVIGELHDAAGVPTCAAMHDRIDALETDGDGNYTEGMLGALRDTDDHGLTAACRMLAGDVDLDGHVTPADLAIFCDAWTEGDAFHADLDRNGAFDVTDLVIAFLGQARLPVVSEE